MASKRCEKRILQPSTWHWLGPAWDQQPLRVDGLQIGLVCAVEGRLDTRLPSPDMRNVMTFRPKGRPKTKENPNLWFAIGAITNSLEWIEQEKSEPLLCHSNGPSQKIDLKSEAELKKCKKGR